jgi:peptidoglycan/LPS O-acetylase OafA/YrhL
VVQHLSHRAWAARWAVVLQGAGSVALLCVLGLSREGSLDYLVPWCVALLILGLAARPRSLLARSLGARPVAWLGQVSYSVYMTHGLVLRLGLWLAAALGWIGTPHVSPAKGALGAVVYVVALLGLSALTYRVIEEPARNWARRRLGSGSPTGASVSPQPERA